jgi:hypothetical protein
VQTLLGHKNIQLILRRGSPSVPEAVVDTCNKLGARLLVVDRGYERLLRQWRRRVAADAQCPVVQVSGACRGGKVGGLRAASLE